MDVILVTLWMGLMALLYATVGQAGGTAYVAILALFAFPPEVMRPTALCLNVVAAGYATWRLARSAAIDWSLLRPIVLPSLPLAFLGGLLVLPQPVFGASVGCVLIGAAVLTVRPMRRQGGGPRPVRPALAAAIGGGVGLLSGITGVGGGVFLAPLLLLGGFATPRQLAGVSAPFILANSAAALAAVLIAGQTVAAQTPVYAIGSLAGAAIGTAIGVKWMSPRAIRLGLAAILFAAGLRLLLA